MKAYIGKIRLTCELDECPAEKSRRDVVPGCLKCGYAVREILDLDGKVIVSYRGQPVEASAPAPRKKRRK